MYIFFEYRLFTKTSAYAFRDMDGDADLEGESSVRVESTSASSGTGLTSLGTSTVYSLIETAHPVFGRVKRLWNSPMESHREVSNLLLYEAVSDQQLSSRQFPLMWAWKESTWL